MTLMSASLAHHISTTYGVVTTAQLIDDGYTEHTIKRQVELGLLVRVHSGVGPLVRQHPLRLPNGVVIHPDGADLTARWAIEVDHVTWHGGRFDAQRDKGRDRGARRIRWQVDRVTDLELAHDFRGTIDDLVELHRLRRHEVLAA